MFSTRSHVPRLPFLLLPTSYPPRGSHAPRAGVAPVPGKTRTILTASNMPCLTTSLRPSLSPVVRLRCPLRPASMHHRLYRVGGALLSHSPRLRYSYSSVATPLRDIQTCVCMRITRVSCAWTERSSSINTFSLSLIVAPCTLFPHLIFSYLCPCKVPTVNFTPILSLSRQHNSSFTSS